MKIVSKLLSFRACQKEIQDEIIIKSTEEFAYGVPAAPIVDRSPAIQGLFLKEEHCVVNIRCRLMKWKDQLMTVKKMIEHEIIYERDGFHSAFDGKLNFC